MADKPGSVENNHSSGTYITACLKQPTQERYGPYLFAMQTALLFGLAPGGVYPATAVTSRAVRSYRTISPLPDESGGIFSVALAISSRFPDVIWHPAHWSPDFPHN